jgi:hypothetical protein
VCECDIKKGLIGKYVAYNMCFNVF